MKLFTITYCLLFTALAQICAQDYTISAIVHDLSPKQVYVASIHGHHQTVIDSAVVKEGAFQFHLNNARPGLYRIILGQTPKAASRHEPPQSFNIILDQQDDTIKLATSFDAPTDSMVVLQSEENKLYYKYLGKKKLFNKKLELLEHMTRLYPNDDQFYTNIQRQYNGLQKELLAYANGLIQKHPSYFLSQIVRAEQYPFLDASLTEEGRLQTLRKNFFKTSDFQDTLILSSDALSNKIISYLGLYRNPGLGEEEQADAFIKAADQILSVAKTGHPVVFDYVLNYVIEGFNEIKQDAVLAYITDNFLSINSCGIEDETLKRVLQKTADYKRTAIGATAPDFTINDNLKLSNIHSDHTLVLFWASWCPHCTRVLPEFYQYYKQHRGETFEVVAVSIDNDRAAWQKAVADGNYDWINYSELKGWESPAARAYNVHATPTMFLLDRDKKIIAKPGSVEQLMNNLAGISVH